MDGAFDFHFQREAGLPYGGEKFAAGLDASFSPAVLLALEAVHIHGQFGGSDEVGEEDEVPAFELRAVAEVEVFGERVVVPAARINNTGLPPDACGAVEIDEASAAVAPGLFQQEMAVEEHGLDAGEEGMRAI